MKPALLLAAMILFCHSAAQPLVCHSAAQRRNLLVAGPSKERSSSQTPGASDLPKTPDTTIDPNWVYATPLRWKRMPGAPKSVKTHIASGTIMILYPEGQLVAITSSLRRDGDGQVVMDRNDGLIIRAGQWARTDDKAIRITAREVVGEKAVVPCGSTLGRCFDTAQEEAPLEIENCALQGTSPSHLSSAIVCRRAIFYAMRLPLDLASLESRANEGLSRVSVGPYVIH